MSIAASGVASWRRTPVITGLGIVSPIGIGADTFWKSALGGRPGIRRLTSLDVDALPKPCRIGGEVVDFYPKDWMAPGDAARAGRFSQFAVAAAKMALSDSGLDIDRIPRDRIQVSFGTAISGLIDVHQRNFAKFVEGKEFVPWVPLEYPAHSATTHIAIEVGAQGPGTSFSTACAAGLDAIAWAAGQVGSGAATVALAGGAEAPLSPFILQCFYNVGVLAHWDGAPEGACRPFEKNRSGLVLAEGAGIVVVEEEEHARHRGAQIYARILGSASGAEGEHLRKVDLSGSTPARVMRQAITAAMQRPEDIDYVSAHGNGMTDYDLSETNAIKAALGEQARRVPVSSLKGMCGQALAGSPPMQIVASCLAIRDHCVPPTINYDEADPRCDLDYVPNVSRIVRVRTAMVHAHSMGGSHTVVILGKL